MAKKPKETAPVAPIETAPVITLASIAAATDVDPYYLFVPSDVGAEWLANGLIETNPALSDDHGAVATRITEAGRNTLTMNDTTNTGDAGTSAATVSTPAPAATEFAIELIDLPAEGRASPAAQNATRYPFDALPAPTTDAEGKPKASGFFVPATAAHPKPWERLASTVSTAKARYGKKIGEREYKAKEAVVGADGKPVLDAEGKPTHREVTKMRDINEYSRVFRITEGVKTIDGVEVKGAWISRTK